MWKRAGSADLYSPPVLFFEGRLARTVLQVIERTVAEETVDLLYALMAGVIPAVCIFKEFM